MIRRIAMWSGPRNISTAMMRAWGARADTAVCDEPFYAHYLQQTGYTHHPGFDQIIASQETDWQKVCDYLVGPIPENRSVFYQKHMAHHLLPHIPLDWTDELTNVFLVRDPREMLLSLIEFIPDPDISETGLPQQLHLFERVCAGGEQPPPVLDAKDVRLSPRELLERLCQEVGIPFEDCMLDWQTGFHPSDGVWAKFWYNNVANSTTFAPYKDKRGELPKRHSQLLACCQEIYDQLACHKMTA